MTKGVDIAALAKLARLEVSKEELQKLEKEIPAILNLLTLSKKPRLEKK